MRLLAALVLGLLSTAPALAQVTSPDGSARASRCMTWLSLASRFSTSQEQRTTFDQQYLKLNRVVSAGTDVVAEAVSAEDLVSNETYDDWVMKFDLADDATKTDMINDVVGKALDCADIIPEEGPAPAP